MSADVTAMLRRLRSRRIEDRRAAVEELSALPVLPPEATRKLCWRLRHDPAEDVREWSAYALGKHRAKEAVPSLKAALQDQVQDVVSISARALGSIGERGAIAPLCARASEECEPVVRCHILIAVADLAVKHPEDTRAARLMKEVFQSETDAPELREIAATALKKSSGPLFRGEVLQSPLDLAFEMPLPPDIPQPSIYGHEPVRVPGWHERPKRDSAVAERAKRKQGWTCQICGTPGFALRGGGLYAEAHHIKSLAEGGPDREDNIVVVCPTCHRKLHHACVSYESLNLRPVAVIINGKRFRIIGGIG